MNTQKEILSKEKLEAKVEILGHKLTEKCHEYGGGIVFVCVMNGAFMFYSDLVKHIQYPIETSFLKCQSYDGLERKETKKPILRRPNKNCIIPTKRANNIAV